MEIIVILRNSGSSVLPSDGVLLAYKIRVNPNIFQLSNGKLPFPPGIPALIRPRNSCNIKLCDMRFYQYSLTMLNSPLRCLEL